MLLIGVPFATGQSIAWRSDLESALRESRTLNRPVWIHVTADWCQPCRSLETFVFKNPTLIRTINERVIPFRAEFDHSTAIIERYQVDCIPFDILLTSDGQVISRRRSPHSVDEFTALIQSIPAPSAQASLLGQARSGGDSPEDAAGKQPEIPPLVNTLRNTQPEQSVFNPFASETESGIAEPQPAVTPSGGMIRPTSPFETATPPTVSARAGNSDALAQTSHSSPTGVNHRFALGGDCPVTLILENRWSAGDPRFGCRHRGQTYLFASAEYLEKFWNDPDRYSPVLAGYDPVIYQEQGQLVLGDKSNGLFMHEDGVQQIVLFYSAANCEKFRAQPDKYVETIRQAVRLAIGPDQ